jgi:hypothetical protein
MMRRIAIVAVAACALLAGACGDDDSGSGSQTATSGAGDGQSALPQGSDPVQLDPADFTTEIDNPYWPMARGNRWVSRSQTERIVVEVTNRTKDVDGIEAVVVRDTVTDNNGDLVEVTDDWYAQDSDGNIWYLGEDVKDYKDGKVVSTAGSWEHGVDGAQAGIAIPAAPRASLEYRQEYYEGKAEDTAKVLSVTEQVRVPAGTYEDCLETEDTTPLEPDAVEHKYYAKGVGPVLNEKVSPDRAREELISFTVE